MLEILPAGGVQEPWLEYLRHKLEEYFGKVIISPSVEVPLNFNERGQALADRLLDHLNSYPARAEKVLAIVNQDITVRGVDYIFGLAMLGGKYAVISPVRLREVYYRRECDYELFLERLIKEALHELGHTLGLPHCSNENCNMKFSSTVYEIDRKSIFFCDDCLNMMCGYASLQEIKGYAANGDGLMKTFLESLKKIRKE